MPELPEVERAAKLTRHVAVGRTIVQVETSEDTIVYTGGITHDEFAKEITGRKVTGVGRYGKVFYIELDGNGRMPVLHLGMTGMIQVKGEEPTWYRRRNKDLAANVWPPPRFLKFIIHFSATETQPPTELAFIDARRLARIRLALEPLKEPPISELGFDPILSMPPFEEFAVLVQKRKCPIKALLLDQSFSAGVGNWVADEILYQAKVHPEQRANNLTEEQLQLVYSQTKSVCATAVAVNADSSQFPSDWLFKYRWGKGQKTKDEMTLPNGETAKIEWLTVGGRTSAVVKQVQKMPAGGRTIVKKTARVEPDRDSDREAGPSKPVPSKGRKRKAAGSGYRKKTDASTEDNESSDLTPVESDVEGDTPGVVAVIVRKSARTKAVKPKDQTSKPKVTRQRKAVASVVEEPPKKKTRVTKATAKK